MYGAGDDVHRMLARILLARTSPHPDLVDYQIGTHMETRYCGDQVPCADRIRC